MLPRSLKVLKLCLCHNIWQGVVKHHYIYVEFFTRDRSPSKFSIEVRCAKPGSKVLLKKGRIGSLKVLKNEIGKKVGTLFQVLGLSPPVPLSPMPENDSVTCRLVVQSESVT